MYSLKILNVFLFLIILIILFNLFGCIIADPCLLAPLTVDGGNTSISTCEANK